MSRNFTTRSRCESELIASLISVTRELNSSLFCIVDQCDPIIRSSHWLVYSPCFRGCQLFSSYLLCHAVSSHDGDLVMCFTWSWLNKKGFRQMCALSRFTSRVREGSFLSVTEEQSRSSTQKHGLLKGGREKASAISQEASENCRQRTAAAPVLRTPRLSARSGQRTFRNVGLRRLVPIRA